MITPKATLLVAVAAVSPILGWMALAMINEEPQSSPPSEPTPSRRISVRLLGPASDITGITVPAHVFAATHGSEFFQVVEPSLVTVTLPDDKKVSLPVKTAFVNTQVDVKTKMAVVVDVDLLPLPKAVSFREAVAELRRLLREADIEPDDQMRKQMATWPDDIGGDFTYRAGMWLSKSAGLGAVVRPTDDGKHFLVLTFAARADAVRPLWDPNFKAAPTPPAERNGSASDQRADAK